MKKAYIRPESRLFAINFTENIAAQSGLADGGDIKYQMIPGYVGLFYTGQPGAPVEAEPNYEELKRWADVLAQQGDVFSAFQLLYNCALH